MSQASQKPRGRGPNKFRPAKIHTTFRLDRDLYLALQTLYSDAWRRHINAHLRKGLKM
jgi:hypothetical protein